MIGRIEEILKGMLSDPSNAVRLAASASLDRLRAKRELPRYLQILKSGSLQERVRIVFAAREIGGTEGVTILLAALEDPAEEVRGASVRELESSLTGTVLKAMVGRLPRESGVVLGNLLEMLGKSRRKELAPIVERYLNHGDLEVRAKAIQALARVAGSAGCERILPLASEKEEAVRVAAARALGEWSSE
ncbi:MAG TPA: HEAT repeat domain-containing protein [Candidatus Aquicultoraceae bacterium]|nr:HEAT repeat domain-containing protein [Candidatus Aquicultoraceae bacterium]